MAPDRPAVCDLLPHRPPMVLLDEIVSCDAASAVAKTTIRRTSPFIAGGGVPVYVGLEYMAQVCGAYAGAIARAKGEAVKIGFLLGTRQYRAHVPRFRVGEQLTISASVLYLDSEMAAFDCRIEIDGRLAAEAQLTVYQPDPAQLLAQDGG